MNPFIKTKGSPPPSLVLPSLPHFVIKSIFARFLLHVYPDETLITETWVEGSRHVFRFCCLRIKHLLRTRYEWLFLDYCHGFIKSLYFHLANTTLYPLSVIQGLPSWGNHVKVFAMAVLSVKNYRYYDPTTRGLIFQGLVEYLGAAPAGAIVLFHACAHNPTGADPTVEQWEHIRQLIRSKGLLPFFYSVYQGFASGSLDTDAHPVRMFVADGGECFIAQSFAKNMGLYGERVGALSIVCKVVDVASRVESQLKLVIRPMYSNPPIHGASIASTILKNSDLYNELKIELKAMADRIISMRKQLVDALSAKGTPGDTLSSSYLHACG